MPQKQNIVAFEIRNLQDLVIKIKAKLEQGVHAPTILFCYGSSSIPFHKWSHFLQEKTCEKKLRHIGKKVQKDR